MEHILGTPPGWPRAVAFLYFRDQLWEGGFYYGGKIGRHQESIFQDCDEGIVEFDRIASATAVCLRMEKSSQLSDRFPLSSLLYHRWIERIYMECDVSSYCDSKGRHVALLSDGIFQLSAAFISQIGQGHGVEFPEQPLIGARVIVTCKWLDNETFQIGDEEPFCVTPGIADTLVAGIQLGGAFDSRKLATQTGRENATRQLRDAVKRYPQLAPYITLPGKKAQGGYAVRIEDCRDR